MKEEGNTWLSKQWVAYVFGILFRQNIGCEHAAKERREGKTGQDRPEQDGKERIGVERRGKERKERNIMK
eukprot:scaffold285295_cov19-Tisochrysis_lutea.AAC.1